ncbi:MAG TPA: hypothetical protein VFX98_15290 [Longimicrobiaceae bacterium]|nr:hypothetical protein [Longimicrobiaceae bacterium]
MIEDLKKLFSEAWAAFVGEVGRYEPEDRVAALLSAMRREMVDARANLPIYEETHRRAEAELARERKALEDATRRGQLAERIGDAETARVAGEFAERHRRRVAVLEEKVRATRAEWELKAEETQEMMRKYKEADSNRFALLAEMRRTGARRRIDSAMAGAPDTPGDDFGRMEERIESDAAYADALDEMADLDGEGPSRRPPPPPDDVEERLREIKRRMGM